MTTQEPQDPKVTVYRTLAEYLNRHGKEFDDKNVWTELTADEFVKHLQRKQEYVLKQQQKQYE